ncbi:YidH family protein [Bdellovibrio bacteriovorus]|uniref:YidH family protein n=1 Tax=Bdellovibrio bacteriovorus TaxID=959 RepID=UPI003A7F8FE5
MEPERTPNEMSQERTDLSEHRTDLSEHRTGLSEHRTELSEHRTELSEGRSDLSAVRSHLANERTHLAYMRTGISLVSLGITMNRFSWFLMENKAISRHGGRPFLDDAKNTGLGMVILGSAMLIWSLYRYSQTAKQIDSHHYMPAHRSVRAFTLALILIGIVSVLWMIVG